MRQSSAGELNVSPQAVASALYLQDRIEPANEGASEMAYGESSFSRVRNELGSMLSERRASHVKVGITDLDGILRGKYLSTEKFLAGMESGLSFCDVIVGWDSNDQLYDNAKVTGWHTAYPDATIRVLPETVRLLPFEDNLPFFLCEFAGAGEAICPRNLLKRVIGALKERGFVAKAGFEYEFFLFDETPHSVRQKRYQDLRTITPGYFGYSILRTSTHADLCRDLLDMCNSMDMPLEGLHTETGAGVFEAALTADAALRSADKAVLFKTFSKVFAQRRNLMACFMAKWSKEWPGQSGHIHVSLAYEDGTSAFRDDSAPHGMSSTMRYFVGGMQRLLPDVLCMAAPTVNSYSRFVPGFWAPTSASWGIENRTTALRVIPGSPSAQRVEYRIAGADANPYLALSAALGSGLWGIENRIEPGEPIVGSSYNKDDASETRLPLDLGTAAEMLKSSKAARSIFGDAFVDHFAATRNWENREFRKHIGDWELARYFEII